MAELADTMLVREPFAATFARNLSVDWDEAGNTGRLCCVAYRDQRAQYASYLLRVEGAIDARSNASIRSASDLSAFRLRDSRSHVGVVAGSPDNA